MQGNPHAITVPENCVLIFQISVSIQQRYTFHIKTDNQIEIESDFISELRVSSYLLLNFVHSCNTSLLGRRKGRFQMSFPEQICGV